MPFKISGRPLLGYRILGIPSRRPLSTIVFIVLAFTFFVWTVLSIYVSSTTNTSFSKGKAFTFIRNTISRGDSQSLFYTEGNQIVLEKLTENRDIEMLIIIPSFYSKKENEYRKTVRATWGSLVQSGKNSEDIKLKLQKFFQSGIVSRQSTSKVNPKLQSILTTDFSSIGLLFFIGTNNLTKDASAALHSEQSSFEDIITLPITESYTSLSRKMGQIHRYLAHYRSYFPNLKWLFKTDTDVFIDIPVLASLATKYNPTKTVLGYRYTHNRVFRTGPWRSQYPGIYYPHYFAGAGYLLSYDISLWIAEQAERGWLRYYNNEDALLGIWIAGLGVRYIDERGIKPMILRHGSKMTEKEVCVENEEELLGKRVVLLHNLGLDVMKSIWESWAGCGVICQEWCRNGVDGVEDQAERK